DQLAGSVDPPFANVEWNTEHELASWHSVVQELLHAVFDPLQTGDRAWLRTAGPVLVIGHNHNHVDDTGQLSVIICGKMVPADVASRQVDRYFKAFGMGCI